VRPLLPLVGATVAAAVIAGCGGDGDEGDGAQLTIEGTAEEAGEIPGGADPEAIEVIDEWSQTLREGDIEGAADYFKLPSIVQNGTPAVQLETREDVIEFNRALPCGAELTRAVTEKPYIVATFELTERPGPGECGPGTGETAKTAFLIEDGLIVRWLRAPVDAAPPAEGPVV
jgi:hypothetical protein